MTRRSAILTSGVFCVFIAAFFLLNLILPGKVFSEQENRYLSQKPAFSFSALFSGDFTSEYERYITDQFAGRDRWIGLKALCELLSGKQENNGVFLCTHTARPDVRDSIFGLDGTLIEPLPAPDEALLATNIEAVRKLCENTHRPVYFALIPDKAELYAQMLPAGAPNVSQSALIDSLYAQTNAKTVDMHSALAEHRDEYIFYRTDHHWTTLGAYYGYTALADAMDFAANPILEGKELSASFYGTTWSSSGFRWVHPDVMEQRVWPSDAVVVTNYPQGKPVDGMVYDYAALETKDKYKVFFGGNTGLMEITTGVSDAPRLLILRDSYCDSLTPYLFEHFSRITILDLRYFHRSISDYIATHDFDAVLAMYSLRTFCADKNVSSAGR